jgi:hypothetical protein
VIRMNSSLTPVVLATFAVAFALALGPLRDARAQAPTPSPTPNATDTDRGTAVMLLDRVAAVLDAAIDGKSTTSGTVGTGGSDDRTVKVVVDRAALDEIRAEIAQIRLLLNAESKPSVALRPREKTEGAR